MKYVFIVVCSLIVNAKINGQIISDRPDQTESSSTITKGNLQIESGLTLTYNDNEKGSSSNFAWPSTLFRYGVTDKLEIRVFNQLEGVKYKTESKRNYGINDLEVGFKFQILRKKDVNTEIALLSHAILPTGSLKFTNLDYGVINKLSISHVLNDNVSVGYNVGYNNYGKGQGDLTYSLAFGFAINDKAGFYLEPYGELVEFEEHVSNFDAGITYLVKENLQLDFSFGTGVNHYMNYVSAGFSWEIKGKK